MKILKTVKLLLFLAILAVFSSLSCSFNESSDDIITIKTYKTQSFEKGVIHSISHDSAFCNLYLRNTDIIFPEIVDLIKADESLDTNYIHEVDSDSIFYFQSDTSKYIYIIDKIYSKKPTTLLISCGSDDGLLVYIDTLLIHTNHKPRSLKMNMDFIRVNLDSGTSVISYKIDQGDGAWGLFRTYNKFSHELLNILYSRNIQLHLSDLGRRSILEENEVIPLLDSGLLKECKHKIVIKYFDLNGNLILEGVDTLKYIADMCYIEYEYFIDNRSAYKSFFPIMSIKSRKSIVDAKKDRLIGDNLWKDIEGSKYSEFYRNNLLFQLIKSTHNVPALVDFPSLNEVEYGERPDNYRVIGRQYSKKIIVLHGFYTEKARFIETYEGRSHDILFRRYIYSNKFKIGYIMPNGGSSDNYETDESVSEVKAILKQEGQENGTTFALVTYSKTCTAALKLIRYANINPEIVVFGGPLFKNRDLDEIESLFKKIKKKNIRYKFVIGEEDKIIDRDLINKLIIRLEAHKIDISVIYQRASNHFNFLYDPELILIENWVN